MLGSIEISSDYIHCLFGVSIIALFIIFLRRIFRQKAGKSFIYTMWIIIPLYMILNSLVSIPLPSCIKNILPEIKEQTEVTNIINTYPELSAKPSEFGTDIYVPNVYLEQDTVNKHIETEIKETAENTFREYNTEALSSTHTFNVMRWIIPLYIAGVCCFFAYICFINLKFSKYCKTDRTYLYHSANLNLPVYKLSGISSPFIMGRTVYIPETMADHDEIYYAVLHEECHFMHGDSLWIYIKYIVFGIYFYNPIIWLAFKYVGHDCELACDEAVIRHINDEERIRYGNCLLHAIDTNFKSQRNMLLSTNMRSGKKLMKQRIENISYKYKKSICSMIVAILVLFSVTGCALMDDTNTAASVTATDTADSVESPDKSGKIHAEGTKESRESESHVSLEQVTVTDENVVKYNDLVSVAYELREVTEETENSYDCTIINNMREYTFRVNEKELFFDGMDYFLEKEGIQKLVQEIQGKSIGDEVVIRQTKYDSIYDNSFVILGINQKEATSYEIPADWKYTLSPSRIGEFYTDGMHNVESADGSLYGFYDKFKNGFSEFIIGSRLFYTHADASSYLSPYKFDFGYHPNNIVTNYRDFTWTEGVSGDGLGEYVELRQLFFGPGEEILQFDELCIVNGYAKNDDIWQKNNRVKQLDFYFEDTFMGSIYLEDTIKPQYIDLKPLGLKVLNGREATFRFEIMDVYKGTKYDDTCITGIEINFTGKDTVKY